MCGKWGYYGPERACEVRGERNYRREKERRDRQRAKKRERRRKLNTEREGKKKRERVRKERRRTREREREWKGIGNREVDPKTKTCHNTKRNNCRKETQNMY